MRKQRVKTLVSLLAMVCCGALCAATTGIAKRNPDFERKTARQTRSLERVAQIRAAIMIGRRSTGRYGGTPVVAVDAQSPLPVGFRLASPAPRVAVLVSSAVAPRASKARRSRAVSKQSAPARVRAKAIKKKPVSTTGSMAHKSKAAKTRMRKVAAKSTPARKPAASSAKRRTTSNTGRTVTRRRRKVRRYSPWDVPTYADSTVGDFIDGEDLEVRRAAVEALGPYNGTVVVVDPFTGRILTIVNQKLALKESYIPCSTVKLVAGIGALSEGVVDPDTKVRLSRSEKVDFTEALARSNNAYFAKLGETLGFDKVSYYARLLGAGERAGLAIDGEQPGVLVSEEPAAGMGRMTSFGDGIEFTALQLASIVSTIANGGTMYYLQYPKSAEEAENLVPRVKRYLDIQNVIDEMKPGMLGATDFGTARRASYDPNEPIFGKTGTCTDKRTHLGWFGSFDEVGSNKLVVTVLLTGGKPVSGPLASGIAGKVYKTLSEKNYFAKKRELSPAAMVDSDFFSQ